MERDGDEQEKEKGGLLLDKNERIYRRTDQRSKKKKKNLAWAAGYV